MIYGYPNYPVPLPGYYRYYHHYPYVRAYPSVNTKIFSHSVQNFRVLMAQGSLLLDKLGEAAFETKMMTAAQQGKQAEVDTLIKSIGLKVPVKTEYTPTGIKFILFTPTQSGEFGSCCSLSVFMKWGT